MIQRGPRSQTNSIIFITIAELRWRFPFGLIGSYSFSIKHEHAYVIVVENGGCNTSHSKRVEEDFYTKYTGK
jgi:hypothetical protein